MNATASTSRQRLIVALDLADPAKARTLATLLAPEVGMFKVGKQFSSLRGRTSCA